MKASLPSRILVPVDFSACSRAALEYAITLAVRIGAGIDVLYVSETPLRVTDEAPAPAPEGTDHTLSKLVGARSDPAMDELLSRAEKAGQVHIADRLASGNASEVVVAIAKNDGYELIVMGTHGRKGLTRLLLGSVAEAVLRAAPCPVLLIRADD